MKITHLMTLFLITLLLLSACDKTNKSNSATETFSKNLTEINPEKIIKNAKQSKSFDLNKDSKPDQIYYFDDNDQILLISRDLNFDQIIDIYEIYNNTKKDHELIDLNFDGTFDLVNTYENEKLKTKHFATDFKATTYATEYYDNNEQLQKVEKDTNADGHVDIWEFYTPNSTQPYKIDTDTDNDTIPDKSITPELPNDAQQAQSEQQVQSEQQAQPEQQTPTTQTTTEQTEDTLNTQTSDNDTINE